MGGATKETVKERIWRGISFLFPAIIPPSSIALGSETYLYVQSGSMAEITKKSLTCWSRVETPGSDSWVPCPLSPVRWCLWDPQPFHDQLLYLRIWNNDNIHFVRLLWWLALPPWDIILTGMPVEDSLYHINWYKSHLKYGEGHSLILGHLRKREGADH